MGFFSSSERFSSADSYVGSHFSFEVFSRSDKILLCRVSVYCNKNMVETLSFVKFVTNHYLSNSGLQGQLQYLDLMSESISML